MDGCFEMGDKQEKICIDNSLWKIGYKEKGKDRAIAGGGIEFRKGICLIC